ncbi:MAG: ATP-binding protein [Pseudomonadota bacterium]|nr:MAG: PAS domain-containing sensor histidine kinase [Pseudomonadota bacterium]
MKLGLRAKLFLISLGLIAVTAGLGHRELRDTVEGHVLELVRDEARVRAALAADSVEARAPWSGENAAWTRLANETATRARAQVTIVGANGRVLGESAGATRDLAALLARPGVRDQLAGKNDAVLVTTEQGRIEATAPIAGEAGQRGIVRLALPLTLLGDARQALARVLAVTVVLALAVSIVVSAIAAELAARSARALAAVARRIAAGDLQTRARSVEGDELGDVGRALDQLAQNHTSSLSKLREERDRLRAILTGMQEGVLLLDAGGRIVLVNPALREMLLLTADAVGKTLLEAIRHAELKELLDRARRSPEPIVREIEIGTIKPRRLLCRVASLEGQPGQIFAVFFDVTEMRRLESVRRDFVANVSHELRTPVAAIRSAAETLQAGIPDDPQIVRQFIGIIERNAARLQDLVEDVLNLSRIESREFRLSFEAVDLAAVFGQILSVFRERANRKGITLVNEIDGRSVFVRADRRALEHVLENLVDNAVKYCPPGAVIRVGAETTGETVRLAVADNGPGIEARHLPRLFERFYRVDAGRSRELGGTGLGLSIVKHLVEAMAGSVHVESTPGVGTTFSFTLRAEKPDPVGSLAGRAVA